ncbi:MAG: AI-2E family transporter [Clostridia bacterium]|nr:AI-2E family transporter [Clostridia bacterium]
MDQNDKNLPENINEPAENEPAELHEDDSQPRKISWNRKYTTIAVYALIVILFAVFCTFFFLNYNDFGNYISSFLSVFNPIFYGILFAYILNKIVKPLENKVLKKFSARFPKAARIICVLFTVIVFAAIILLIVWTIIPQVISGYNDLESKMEFYIASFRDWLQGLVDDGGAFSSYVSSILEYVNNIVDKFYEFLKDLIPLITSAAPKIVVTLKDILLGLVFSIYFLIAKEHLCAQIKKLTRAMFGEKFYSKSIKFSALVDEKFGSFLSERLLESFIIGLITLLFGVIIGIPYYPLISIVLGVSNIVPLFGPIVGIFVSSFIILISSMNIWMLIGFIIFEIAAQIVQAAISRSRAVGRNGLSATWIFVSIILMTGLFGIAGTVIGVPAFAVLYEIISDWTKKRLAKKEMPTETEDYMSEEDRVRMAEEDEASKQRKAERNEKYKALIARIGKKRKK